MIDANNCPFRLEQDHTDKPEYYSRSFLIKQSLLVYYIQYTSSYPYTNFNVFYNSVTQEKIHEDFKHMIYQI